MIDFLEPFNFHVDSAIKNKLQNCSKSFIIHEIQDIMSPRSQSFFEFGKEVEERHQISKEAFSNNREKITTLKLKYNNIQFPINIILDCLINVFDLLDKWEGKETIMKKLDNLNQKKNTIFLGLKTLESEILKNDSNYRNISKYLKSINTIFEKFKELKNLNTKENGFEEIQKEFLAHLKNFKKLNVNNMRKYDIMNSLTLKSEYSEDFSEMASVIEDINIKNIITNNIDYPRTQERTNEKNQNDTVGDIIQGLTRVKTDDDKLKMSKKIKNKRLKYSNANSDLDITEGNKKSIKEVVPKIKSNNELKVMKSKSILNNTNRNSILSPRFSTKSNQIFTSGNKNIFSNTHTNFRLDNKIKKNLVNSSNVVTNLYEKGKFQSSIQIKRDENSILSDDVLDLNKVPSPDKKVIDDRQLKGRDESGATMVDDAANTFSPSTSSQIGTFMFSPVEPLDSVSDEWMVSPLNKIPIRTSKLITEKHKRAKVIQSMPDYLNLK